MVSPAAGGQLGQRGLDAGQPLAVGGRAGDRASLLGQPASVLDDVEPDNADAGRDEQPHHQLADEAETDHQAGLAELRLGPPDALHGNRAHGGKRRLLRGNSPRHRGAQVDRDPVVFGVQGVFIARGRDQLADFELLGAGADLDNDTAQRVAQRCIGVQAVHDLLISGHRALLSYRVQNLAHLIWPGPGLAHHGQLGLVHLHHLGTGGDQREQRLHQDPARTAGRHRPVQHGELTRLIVLRDLLHDVLVKSCRDA